MPSIVDIGLGKVGGNSHPIHPATVHLPIAFLVAASGLDILTFIGVSSSSLLNVMVNVSSIFSPTASPVAVVYHLCLFSYVSTLAGVLTSFPAITSGLFEAYAMISAKGLDLSNPVIKTTLIHAGLNDLVIFGAVYNMLSRWGNEAYMPTGSNTLVSFLMLGGVGYAAFLGGGLVYTHGVGVQRMGKGKEEKDAEVAKEKVEAKKEL
ncbi:hypothetical protein IFR04_013616 [Cadophora malorum]|uniref:DUF2231 domain-containing protein n=1 Tax=Cadophora malorum TaxID=108018 RepID=A0A8H7T293_9HELO|nr:hypothetical protein IFR04_013616 [Cadophora malorum]